MSDLMEKMSSVGDQSEPEVAPEKPVVSNEPEASAAKAEQVGPAKPAVKTDQERLRDLDAEILRESTKMQQCKDRLTDLSRERDRLMRTVISRQPKMNQAEAHRQIVLAGQQQRAQRVQAIVGRR